MITLDFTPEEVQILHDMIESCITDLRMEIRETDRLAYKEMLKNRELILKKMMDAVQQAQIKEAI
jgi:hypothetical protein